MPIDIDYTPKIDYGLKDEEIDASIVYAPVLKNNPVKYQYTSFKKDFLSNVNQGTIADKAYQGLVRFAQSVEYTPINAEIIYNQGKYLYADWIAKDEKLKEEAIKRIDDLDNWKNERAKDYDLDVLYEEGSFVQGLVQSTGNYGLQIIGGLMAPYAGLAVALTQVATETAGEGVSKYKQRNGGSIDGYGETIPQEMLGNVIKTGLNGIVEKKFGIPSNLKKYTSMLRDRFKKAGFKGGVEAVFGGAVSGGGKEAGTETVQSITDTLADKYLLKRFDNDDELSQAIYENMMGVVYASILGGATGGIMAGVSRKKAINGLKQEYMKQNIPEEEAEKAAATFVDGITHTLKDEIDAQLKESYEIRTRHGEIYQKFYDAAYKAYKDAGALEELSESQLAQIISKAAEKHADIALAESIKRQVPVKEVFDEQRIKYLGDGRFTLEAPLEEATTNAEQGVQEQTQDTTEQKPYKTIEEQAEAESLIDGIKSVDEKQAEYEYKDVGGQSSSDKVIDTIQGADKNTEQDIILVANKRLPVKYKVVELDSLKTSHDVAGNMNDDYPQQLQNRDRSRPELINQIRENAVKLTPERLDKNVVAQEGGPVIIGDNVVVMGNGRANTLRIAYDLGKQGQEYKDYLKRKGYDIEGFDKPVLVRVMQDEYTPEQWRALIDRANISDTFGLSQSEAAINDAEKLNPKSFEKYNPDEELTSAENRGFLKQVFNEIVPESQRGQYIDKDGYLTPAGVNKIKSAMLGYLLPNGNVLSSILETEDPILRKTSNALLNVATKIVALEEDIKAGAIDPNYSIIDDIRNAFELYVGAKRSKQDVDVYINNLDMFRKPDNNVIGLANLFLKSRNSKEISTVIDSYISAVENEGNLKQGSLLGESQKQNKQDILNSLFGKNELYQDQVSIAEENEIYQDQVSLAEENARLDDIYPEYMGETIDINGKEKTVYNSTGKRIAKSAEALRNFYNWFGNSKVVNEQGRPLVVYHGTNKEFDFFDIEKIKNTSYGSGFNFSENEKFSQGWGETKPFYLKIENIVDPHENNTKISISDIDEIADLIKDNFVRTDETSNSFDENLKHIKENINDKTYRDIIDEIQYLSNFDDTNTQKREIIKRINNIIKEVTGIDGFIGSYDKGKIYVALNPNQIKSTNNRGTFINENDNFYKQKTTESVKKGSYDPDSKVIQIFKDADASTLPHELAHYWLDNIYDYANSGKASQEYLNSSYKAITDYLGKPRTALRFSKAQSEKFAAAYEKYLRSGNLPQPIFGKVFNDYDEYLKDVYKSLEDITISGTTKKPVLTPEIIKFFQSWTTANLDSNSPIIQKLQEQAALDSFVEDVEKSDKEAREYINSQPEPSTITQPERAEVQAPTQEIADKVEKIKAELPTEETVTNEDLTKETHLRPVQSDGKTMISRFAERIGAGEVEYNAASNEEQANRAKEMWDNDPKEAQRILDSGERSDEVLRNALYEEQQKRLYEKGDIDECIESARKQSAENTLLGQEIQFLSRRDSLDPVKWLQDTEAEYLKLLADKNAKTLNAKDGKTNSAKLLNAINEKADSIAAAVSKAETKAERANILYQQLKAVKEEFKGLKQPELRNKETLKSILEETTDLSLKKAIENEIQKQLGIRKERPTELFKEVDILSQKYNDKDEFGNPKAGFFKQLEKVKYIVNEQNPTSLIRLSFSSIGKSLMLSGTSTEVLNVVSSFENMLLEKLTRNITNRLSGHTNAHLVNTETIKAYRKTLREAYKYGYDIASMQSPFDEIKIKGEDMQHAAGKGAIRAAARGLETAIMRWWIGAPDAFFKSHISFVNYANNEASQIAIDEQAKGHSIKSLKERATEIFKDAVKIQPETPEGLAVRQKAMMDALAVTFQNESRASKTAMKFKKALDYLTFKTGAADIISPFVKTPANLVGLSYGYTFGWLESINPMYKAFKLKNSNSVDYLNYLRTDEYRNAAKSLVRSGIGWAAIAAFLLVADWEDDDYIEDYSRYVTDSTGRQIAREMGHGTFGAIRIGNIYFSTEYLGALEIPIVAALKAKQGKTFTDKIKNFVVSSNVKALADLPVLRDIIDIGKELDGMEGKDLDVVEYALNTGDELLSRFVPQFVSNFADITDEYERITYDKRFGKTVKKIPFSREDYLAPKVSALTGRPIETKGWANILFAGSRAAPATDSRLLKEVSRLHREKKGVGLPKIDNKDWFKKLTETKKNRARKLFAKEYNKEATALIRSAEYKKMGNDDKADALRDVSRKVSDKIKKEFVKK